MVKNAQKDGPKSLISFQIKSQPESLANVGKSVIKLSYNFIY